MKIISMLHPLVIYRYKQAIRGKLLPQKKYAAIHNAGKANLPEACRYLGAGYLTGSFGGGIFSIESAHYWLKKATDLGDVPAWYWRARLALTTQNIESESLNFIPGLPEISIGDIPSGLDAAIKFCKYGQDLGDNSAKHLRLRLLYMQAGENTDYAITILHEAANNNQSWAMIELAEHCLQDDERAAPSKGRARNSTMYWLSRVASQTENQNGKYHLLMAKAMEQGIFPKNSTNFRKHLKCAAEAQIPEAWFRYGVFLLKADRDGLNAEAWLRKAADAGYSDAAATLGDWITMGCPDISDEIGISWYMKAITMGHVGTMLHISRMIMIGKYSKIKIHEAKKWLREIINSGKCGPYEEEAKLIMLAMENKNLSRSR